MPARPPTKPSTAHRFDGKLSNALTGLGVLGVDAAESTRREPLHYTPSRARAEYRGSWAAQREIDRPANDLIRGGFTLKDLPVGVDTARVLSYLSDIGNDAAEVPEDQGVLPALSRLYAEGFKQGGAALIIVVEDGLAPSEPLDLRRIKRLVSLELVERDEIAPLRDASGRVKHYMLGSARTSQTASTVVHHSRVILAKGVRLSPSEEWTNQGWGASRLETLHNERMGMHAAVQETASLVLKTSTTAVYLADLQGTLASEDPSAAQALDAQLDMMASGMSQHRLVPMDAGTPGGEAGNIKTPARHSDRIETIARPVQGVSDLVEVTENHWAAGTGQTPSIALGRTPGGLNSGENAGDWQSWASYIDGERETWLRPRLDRLLTIAFAAQDGPTAGEVPETWEVVFGALWQPSDAERENQRKIRAEADNVYVAMGAISAGEVAEQRFIAGTVDELHMAEMPSEQQLAPESAAVGVFTASIQLMQALYPAGVPVEAGRALMQALAPAHFNTENVGDIFPATTTATPAHVPENEADADADAEDVETSDVDLAWSENQLPADAMEARQIAAELGVPTVRVTRAHRAGMIEGWNILGGKPRYSLAAVKRVVLEGNGKLTDADVMDRSEDDKAEIRSRWQSDGPNMGPAKMRKWLESPFSGPKRKSGDERDRARRVSARALRLMEKSTADWSEADYTGALQVLAFIERMTNVDQGEPLVIDGREGPSARDASLRDWGFDPK